MRASFHCEMLLVPSGDVGPKADVISERGMLTPPGRLLPTLMCPRLPCSWLCILYGDSEIARRSLSLLFQKLNATYTQTG